MFEKFVTHLFALYQVQSLTGIQSKNMLTFLGKSHISNSTAEIQIATNFIQGSLFQTKLYPELTH